MRDETATTRQNIVSEWTEPDGGSVVVPSAYLKARRFIELFFIIAFSPVILLVMAVITVPLMVRFNGKAIYKQLRAGINGKPFTIYKFRTMNDIPEFMENYFEHNEDRVPKLGAFLRRHRIDELPQFWNVLKGEMSIIGPRPEVFQLYEIFSTAIPNFRQRKVILPGITGWAQVNLPHTVTLDGNRDKLGQDIFYINNISLNLDLRIVFRTIVLMMSGKYSR